MSEQNYWRKCSICKKEIPFNSIYHTCSVSTCRKSVYCSVNCWDQHLPYMNHKEAWAEEQRSPTREKFFSTQVLTDGGPRRRIVRTESSNSSPHIEIENDILIVASKLKNYVKITSDMNTSADVMNKLSDIVRRLCDDAISRAKSEGRKTLMDRDF